MKWIKINERLLEMERNPIDSDEFKKEWNNLLSLNVPGVLNRKKYEEPKRKDTGKTGTEKKGQGKDVGDVPKDLAGTTTI